jgi:predicted ATPase
VRPLALFVDDLQWGDDDSLRLLRYIVRAVSAMPILLMCSVRPEELALVTEAVNLLADMERVGLVRRLRIERFTQFETRELSTGADGSTRSFRRSPTGPACSPPDP